MINMFGNEFTGASSLENTADAMDDMETLEAADMENTEAPDISESADAEQLIDALGLTDEEAEIYKSVDSLPTDGVSFKGTIYDPMGSDFCPFGKRSCNYYTNVEPGHAGIH